MGLLICIVSFSLGFAAVLTAVAQLRSDFVDNGPRRSLPVRLALMIASAGEGPRGDSVAPG